MNKNNTTFALLTASGLVVVLILLLEFTLRVISPPSVYTPLLPLYPNVKMKLAPQLKGVSPETWFTTNSWGLRGEEPPWDWDDTLTLVAVGGSTTQCFYLDDNKTWPHLVQKILREHLPKVWMGNGGLDGQSSRAHIVFFREVLPKIKPDITLVLVGMNDLMISLNESDRLGGRKYDRRRNRPQNLSWLEKNSRTVQLFNLWSEILFKDAVVKQDTGHGNYKPDIFEPDSDVPLPKDLRELLPGLSEYRQNLMELNRLGKEIGTRVLFLTQPLMFHDSELWEKRSGYLYFNAETTRRLSAATTWKLMDIYNQELLAFCREEGADCFDLASEIPHTQEMFYDGVHFTEAGADRVARVVADFIKTSSVH